MSDPNKGQILPESRFGLMLTDLARDAEIIVETGTWKGQGSTLCLAKGLVRATQRIISFETNEQCAREAKEFYASEPRVTIIRGAISVDSGLPTLLLYPSQFLPDEIDLALIDGGECNGRTDMDIFFPRAKIIALDDTLTEKNKLNREQLLSVQWQVLADVTDDRNGWAIFKRPSN